MSNRSKDESKANRFYIEVENDNKCTYCGEPATVKDHFTPISFAARTIDCLEKNKKLVLLPACTECNSIAWCKTFLTVREKRRYIQDRLKTKYKNFLNMKLWTKEELDELGPSMRSFTLDGLWQKRRLLRRLEWQNGKKLESVKCAILSSQRQESGENSATPGANSNGTISKSESLSSMLRSNGLEGSKANRLFLKEMIEEFGEDQAKVILKQLPKPRTW